MPCGRSASSRTSSRYSSAISMEAVTAEAESRADRQGGRRRRRRRDRLHDVRPRIDRGHGGGPMRQGRLRRRTHLVRGVAQLESCPHAFAILVVIDRQHSNVVALVHRSREARLHRAALQPVEPPGLGRRMRQVRIEIDPGDEAAAEPEAARHLVVVDLVARVRRGVVGLNVPRGQSRHVRTVGAPRHRLSGLGEGDRTAGGAELDRPFAAVAERAVDAALVARRGPESRTTSWCPYRRRGPGCPMGIDTVTDPPAVRIRLCPARRPRTRIEPPDVDATTVA